VNPPPPFTPPSLLYRGTTHCGVARRPGTLKRLVVGSGWTGVGGKRSDLVNIDRRARQPTPPRSPTGRIRKERLRALTSTSRDEELWSPPSAGKRFPGKPRGTNWKFSHSHPQLRELPIRSLDERVRAAQDGSFGLFLGSDPRTSSREHKLSTPPSSYISSLHHFAGEPLSLSTIIRAPHCLRCSPNASKLFHVKLGAYS